MTRIPIEISCSRFYTVEVDSDHFGELFAKMSSDDQVSVLRAMVEHMKPHQTQWDYIAIELESPENADVRRHLREVLFGGDAE